MAEHLPNDFDPVRRGLERIMDAGLQHGDIITHEALHEALEIAPPRWGDADTFRAYGLKLMRSVEAMKEMLLTEHRMYLQSVRGTGYRVVHPHEQAGIAWSRMVDRVRSAVDHAIQATANVEQSELNAEQRAHVNDTQARASTMRAMVDSAARKSARRGG